MFEESECDHINTEDYFFYMEMMKEAEELEEFRKIQESEEKN